MSFNKSQRRAALICQGLASAAGLEADHDIPKSRGGADDVANLRYIAADTNRKKSNHMIELRQWQKDFLDKFNTSESNTFLCVAAPGGGKTVAALKAARSFLDAGYTRRLLIVVPTVNLKDQWLQEGHKFGINLQDREFNGSFKEGFHGGVTTYQSLDSGAQQFRCLLARSPALVILDEPHHCGDKQAWGENARLAFEPALRRLLLSGTPFRTDGRPIPFVRYDTEGVCIADHKYTYRQALRDRVLRSFCFDYSRGKYEEMRDGRVSEVEFHGELSEDVASERLRHILNPRGGFVAEEIRVAHEKLKDVRQSIPDAAAMAVCMDTDHAERVADVIRRVTGTDPSIVVSDEETATDTVEEFRRSKRQWLVSVRQVSEGTDIKRLQVLCYLTNATTELFFLQLIGRVSRVRFQDGPDRADDDARLADRECYVFLPADPRLIAHAKRIEEDVNHVRKVFDEEEEEERERTPRERDEQEDGGGVYFLSSTHDGTDRVVVGTKEYDLKAADTIRKIASHGVTMDKAAKIYDDFWGAGAAPVVSPPADVPAMTAQAKVMSLRQEITRLVSVVAKAKFNNDYKRVHTLYTERLGRFVPTEEMGVRALEAKRDWLKRLLEA